MNLQTSVSKLKGVGPVKAEAFANRGVETVGDLLHYYPRDYIFAVHREIADVQLDEFVVVGGLTGAPRDHESRVSMPVFRGGHSVQCIWFNQPHVVRVLQHKKTITVWGKVTEFNGKLQIVNPGYSFTGPPANITKGGMAEVILIILNPMIYPFKQE